MTIDIDDAINALLAYQQADMEGTMVLTSRQAIHEVANEIRRIRAVAQSPVVWRVRYCGQWMYFEEKSNAEIYAQGDNNAEPLYAAQPPAAPVETATKSAPVFLASQSDTERLPSSDAAGAGADTRCSAATGDEPDSRLPLQYEDGPDYCTVKDAQGRDFALTMQPELMRAMERALREDISRLLRPPVPPTEPQTLGQWQPIDTAPREPDAMFMVCAVGDARGPFVVRSDILWRAREAGTPSHLGLDYLTHWMPLPEMPQ